MVHTSGTHERTEYDWAWHATGVWQSELRQRLCTWKEVCKNEEEAIRRAECGDEPKRRYNLQLDDCSEDPEWSSALFEARLKKLSGEWSRRICGGRCGGVCDRMYRDPHKACPATGRTGYGWIRHKVDGDRVAITRPEINGVVDESGSSDTD